MGVALLQGGEEGEEEESKASYLGLEVGNLFYLVVVFSFFFSLGPYIAFANAKQQT